MTGPADLSVVQLAGAAMLVLVNAGLSVWLGFSSPSRWLIASLRTVVQLMLLGYVLVPIFRLSNPFLVLAMASIMVGIAAREAAVRSGTTSLRSHASTFVALALAASVTLAVAMRLVIGVDPWWSPRYLIPLLGMVLGNSLTGVSIGLERCLGEFRAGRSRVEALLCFGATPWEAMRPVLATSLNAALLPILNSMSVVGLVTIPGMMTGQILSGTRPELAARYQILIMFSIASATAMGATIAVCLVARSRFDDQGRLRP